jgi:NAD(P)H-dependent nitrite reductase small subunit
LKVKTATPRAAWTLVGKTWEFPEDGGSAVKHGKTQVAVYNFASRGEWYATQNMCPHKREFVLSRGLLGDQTGTPKVACPQHKKTFSLVRTFAVKVDGDDVYVQLPPVSELDAELATAATCNKASECVPA